MPALAAHASFLARGETRRAACLLPSRRLSPAESASVGRAAARPSAHESAIDGKQRTAPAITPSQVLSSSSGMSRATRAGRAPRVKGLDAPPQRSDPEQASASDHRCNGSRDDERDRLAGSVPPRLGEQLCCFINAPDSFGEGRTWSLKPSRPIPRSHRSFGQGSSRR